MLRALSLLSRIGLGGSLALVVHAVSRLGPVYAQPPLDVPGLPAAAAALGFGVVAALTGASRSGRSWRGLLASLLGVVALLGIVVAARGRTGLAGEVTAGGTVVGRTARGPIDLIGRDLRAFPVRRPQVEWNGELRVPEAGRFSLWIEGAGRGAVELSGQPLLAASGTPFRAERPIVLGRGPVALRVRFEQAGPGSRMRLGWTRPGGRPETVPPRYLGPISSTAGWLLTDGLAAVAGLLVAFLAFLAPWDAPRTPSAPRTVGARELAVATLAFVALVVVMSWPLARDLAHSGPLYRPDGRLNAWILAWSGHAFWREPGRLFQAPDFHPLPDSLAFSENMVLPGALAAPLVALGGPVLAYDVTLLASLALSGLGAYLLVRRAGGSPLAAFVGAAYFAAGPHRWTRMTHLQAQLTVFLPLSLVALDRFWERRTLRRALLIGVLLAAQGMSSVYLGAITATVLAVAVAVALLGGLRRGELLRLAASFALALLLLWPAALPYFRTRALLGQEFSVADVSGAATNLVSYAASGTALWGPLTQRHLGTESLPDTLFPGVTVLLLGVAGLAAAPRRYRAVALAACVVAVWFSLGPETALYRWLHDHLVLVRVVRVLSRFSVVPALALSVLAGLALSGRHRLLALAALAAMMAESSNLPLRVERYDGPRPAARWLARGSGAVAYLPLGDDSTREMLDGLVHLRPLVNGNGAFMPRPYDRALELLGGRGLDEEGLRFLRAVGVRHVVSRDELPLPRLADLEGERVYEVPEGPAVSPVAAGRPTPTRWTDAGAVLDVGAPTVVSAVVFEIDDRPWLAAPKLRVSADGSEWREVQTRASLAEATLSTYREPRHARGRLRFEPVSARFFEIEAALPARRGALEVEP